MNHVMLDSDDGGNLDAMDTEMNWGGDGPGEFIPYGPSGGERDMSQVYSQTDLDDMMKRRKIMKAEKMMVQGEARRKIWVLGWRVPRTVAAVAISWQGDRANASSWKETRWTAYRRGQGDGGMGQGDENISYWA